MSVLRIYWGSARFMLDSEDPKVAAILALLVADNNEECQRPEEVKSPSSVPTACKKCGSHNRQTNWTPVMARRDVGTLRCSNPTEHLHVHCRQCHWEWDEPVLTKET